MDGRDYDLVLQGATGFTGQQAAAELATVAPEGLRWAVAGRDSARVRAVAERHGVPAVVADGLDEDAVARLAASTQVVISCAGPFRRYGTPLVRACVAQRTHYADLTGEQAWVKALIAAHHEEARRIGVTLIPASGVDCVPSDLAVQALLAQSPGTTRITGFFRTKLGLNGGTLATGLDVAEQHASDAQATPSPRFAVPSLDGWAAPYLLADMDEFTVRRSLALQGTHCDYREHFLASGRFAAWGMATQMRVLGSLMARGWGRALLRRFGPKPGEGPSEKMRRETVVRFHALAGDPAAPDAALHWTFPGDPANVVTVHCLVQTGLALAAGEARAAGILTPATALGERLRARLEETGALKVEAAAGAADGRGPRATA